MTYNPNEFVFFLDDTYFYAVIVDKNAVILPPSIDVDQNIKMTKDHGIAGLPYYTENAIYFKDTDCYNKSLMTPVNIMRFKADFTRIHDFPIKLLDDAGVSYDVSEVTKNAIFIWVYLYNKLTENNTVKIFYKSDDGTGETYKPVMSSLTMVKRDTKIKNGLYEILRYNHFAFTMPYTRSYEKREIYNNLPVTPYKINITDYLAEPVDAQKSTFDYGPKSKLMTDQMFQSMDEFAKKNDTSIFIYETGDIYLEKSLFSDFKMDILDKLCDVEDLSNKKTCYEIKHQVNKTKTLTNSFPKKVFLIKNGILKMAKFVQDIFRNI